MTSPEDLLELTDQFLDAHTLPGIQAVENALLAERADDGAPTLLLNIQIRFQRVSQHLDGRAVFGELKEVGGLCCLNWRHGRLRAGVV